MLVPTPGKRTKGFTLIEMVVVLVLLGMVYALAGPYIGAGQTALGATAATRQLAAGLRKARSVAVADGREAVLTVDVENRRFQVTGDPKVYELPKGIDLKLYTAQKELLDDKIAGIRFLPDGSSTGGRITVSIGQVEQIVDVDWVTGSVAVR
jgi:general secretion pathway protein H